MGGKEVRRRRSSVLSLGKQRVNLVEDSFAEGEHITALWLDRLPLRLAFAHRALTGRGRQWGRFVFVSLDHYSNLGGRSKFGTRGNGRQGDRRQGLGFFPCIILELQRQISGKPAA